MSCNLWPLLHIISLVISAGMLASVVFENAFKYLQAVVRLPPGLFPPDLISPEKPPQGRAKKACEMAASGKTE